MNNCNHTWLYIGSKRQKVWRCTLCDEYRVEDPKQKREWQSITKRQIEACMETAYKTVQGRNLEIAFARAIEAILRENNNFCSEFPKKEWVGLTDEEALDIEHWSPDIRWAIIRTDAMLREKNS